MLFSTGETTACLKEVGKIPSESERLISGVMGTIGAFIQDFNNLIQITSREQGESVENSIRLRISSREAGSKFESPGRFGIFEGTVVPVLLKMNGIVQQNLTILSSKNLRKEVARAESELVLENDFGMVRRSKESRFAQSFIDHGY